MESTNETTEGAETEAVIHCYTREEALEDGVLVDVTEWASASKGFHGGFTCPVALTRKLWVAIERPTEYQDTRGRAHDVLWMASLAARGVLKRDETSGCFRVILRVGRTQNQVLRLVLDGDGVTIGFREDEW